MALILETPPILILVAAALCVTLVLGIHWAADRYLNRGTSDEVFYWALGGVAVSVSLVLLQFVPA